MWKAGLVAVGGLIASGKSTVARRLATLLDAELLSADETRQQFLARGRREALAPGFAPALYAELLQRARAPLCAGRPLVLDATFQTRALRAQARAVAAECGVPFRFVECRADPDTCRERLRGREQQGEAGWLALFETFLAGWEPVDELPAGEHVVLDTARPLEAGAALELEIRAQGIIQ